MSNLSLESRNKFWIKSKIKALSFWRTRKGERINFISHFLGAFLSLIGTILLIQRAIFKYNPEVIWGFVAYGTSLFLMFASSTLYHASKKLSLKKKLQVLDHCSIYLLIAGTYTPFTLTILKQTRGLIILIIVWTIAIVGIIYKLLMKDKYDFLSTMAYLAMGWVILIDIKNFYQLISIEAFSWVLAGGILYSIGAVFYLIERMPRNHEVWHFFVLSASICHFIGIYFYL
jgi:hemolysin III